MLLIDPLPVTDRAMVAPLVLVLEDEELISLDLEFALADAGFTVAVARSCAEAADFLADQRPDVAILDVRLRDGECTAAAQKLLAQGVPFIVHSAFVSSDADEVFRSGTLVHKPAGTPDLVKIFRELASGS